MLVAGQEDSAIKARVFHPIMNKKTKTMYVMQPGCFGSGGMLFSTYEIQENSREDQDIAESEVKELAPQHNENRTTKQVVVRFNEALRRLVRQTPLRRVLPRMAA